MIGYDEAQEKDAWHGMYGTRATVISSPAKQCRIGDDADRSSMIEGILRHLAVRIVVLLGSGMIGSSYLFQVDLSLELRVVGSFSIDELCCRRDDVKIVPLQAFYR